jgi:poly(3-hydroxybutyrate) depolymerase
MLSFLSKVENQFRNKLIRKFFASLVSLAIYISLLSSSEADIASILPDPKRVELNHGGRNRYALIFAPERSLNSNRREYLYIFHGAGQNIEQSANTNFREIIASALKRNISVIIPAGTQSNPESQKENLVWNDGNQCCGDALSQNVDDTGFIIKLNEVLIDNPDAQINALGYSNGGGLLQALILEQPGFINGTAIFANTYLNIPAGYVPQANTISNTLIIHGLNDSAVPLNGGFIASAFNPREGRGIVEGWTGTLIPHYSGHNFPDSKRFAEVVFETK